MNAARLQVMRSPDSNDPVLYRLGSVTCHEGWYHDVPVIEGDIRMRCTNCGGITVATVTIQRDSSGIPCGYLVSPPRPGPMDQ